MTTSEMSGPAFLVALGGKWTTDCGCRTVTDRQQPHPHISGASMPTGGQFVVSQHCLYEGGLVSSSTTWHGCFDDVEEAVSTALNHDCRPGLVTEARWLRPGDDGYVTP